MKIFLLAFLIFAALGVTAGGQVKGPETVAKEFYKWYLTELNAERYPIRQDKTRMLEFLSAHLGRWVYSAAYSEYGADYFIDAQDWDPTWVDSISVTRSVVKGNTATLRINLEPSKGGFLGFGRRVLPIKLVKENGAWKIDMVNDRKLTK